MEDTDICRIGTPLEPIAEDEVPSKKPITPADQIVVDENGKRRFHGAFTGGFSAGYWNTVGSKEGWKPQTFKSSRSEKSSIAAQNPMDFMDEEDTSEFGIAPQRIQTTQDFTQSDETGKSRKRGRKFEIDNQGPIPGVPVLHLLLESCNDKTTVNMLKKMGWKTTQRPKRKRQESSPDHGNSDQCQGTDGMAEMQTESIARVVSCDMGPIKRPAPSDDDDESDELSDSELAFEVDEFDSYVVGVKDDRFGIDYTGLDRSTFSGGSSSSVVPAAHFNLFAAFEMVDQNQKKLSIKGQAFGVGAFEEDDEDIYARDDLTRYDFAMGDKSKKDQKPVKKQAIAAMGDMALDGFHSVDITTKSGKKIFRVSLPNAYEPRNWLKRKSRFSPMMAAGRDRENGAGKIGRHDMTPTERGTKLGEKQSIVQSALIELAAIPSVSNTHAADTNTKSSEPAIAPSKLELPKTKDEANDNKIAHIPFISDRFVSSNKPIVTDKVEIEVVEKKIDKPVVEAEKKVLVVRTKILWKPCQLLSYKMNVETVGGSKPDSRPNSFSLFSCLTEGSEATMKKPLQFTKTNETYDGEENELLKLRQRDRMITQKREQNRSVPSTSKETSRIDLSQQIQSFEFASNQNNLVISKRNQPKSDFEMDILKRQDEHPSQKKDIFKAVFDSSDDDDNENELNEKANEYAKKEAMASLLVDTDTATNTKPKNERNTQAVLNLTQTAEEVNILRNNSPPRGIFAGLAMSSVPLKTVETLTSADTGENESSLTDGLYGPSLPKISPIDTTFGKTTTAATMQQSGTNIPPKFLFNPKVATNIIRKDDEWVEKSDAKIKKEKKSKKEKKEKKKLKKEKHKSHHKDKKKKK